MINTNELKALVTDEICTDGHVIAWNGASYANYSEANEGRSTFRTTSSMDMFSDLESSCSNFLDFMEIRDVMDAAGMSQDYAFGLVFDLNDNHHIYIELDIIHAAVFQKEQNITLRDIVDYALEIRSDFAKFKGDLPDHINTENLENFIHPFKTAL